MGNGVHNQNNRQRHKTREARTVRGTGGRGETEGEGHGWFHRAEGWDQINTIDEADRTKGSSHGGIRVEPEVELIELKVMATVESAKQRAETRMRPKVKLMDAWPEGGTDETDGGLGRAGGEHGGLGGSGWIEGQRLELNLVPEWILGLDLAQKQKLELDLAPEQILGLDLA